MRSVLIRVRESGNFVGRPGLGPLPVAHPVNCKCECPYGRGRSFCWPCMNKLLFDRKDERAVSDDV